mgnify:CR=1 FL=1
MRLIINLISLIALAGGLLFQFLPASGTGLPAAVSYIYAGYLILVVLSLPSLMGKVLFRSGYFGVTPALLFLFYPLIYIVNWAISQFFNADYSQIARLTTIIITVYWHYLLLIATLVDKQFTAGYKAKFNTIKLLPLVLIPFAIYVLFIFMPLRQVDSVVALDYMQHKAVVNQMAVQENLCLQPVDCSNLFLQQGYTTFYHTIYAPILSSGGLKFEQVVYILDLIFPLLAAALLFKIALKFTRKTSWSLVASALGIVFFIGAAYTTQLFLPQTLAFFLYLHMISSNKLSGLKVILGSVLLILCHFIMGPFLAVQLVLFYLIKKYYQPGSLLATFSGAIVGIAGLIMAFVILINFSGFSIERNLQTAEVEALGTLTNLYYPDNISFYLMVIGFGWLILVPALVSALRQKQKPAELLWALLTIYVATLVFFLAPTYAAKFLIGFGFAASLVLVNYLSSLKLTPQLLTYIIAALLVSSSVFIAYANYKSYLSFYDQGNGRVNALVERDRELADFLSKAKGKTDLNCRIISDPYTQIVVASASSYQTAYAQYMPVELRQELFDLIQAPNEGKYRAVVGYKTDKYTPAESNCLLYSYRLTGTTKDNEFWLGSVYNLNLNPGETSKVSQQDPIVRFMRARGHGLLFADENYILFSATTTL